MAPREAVTFDELKMSILNIVTKLNKWNKKSDLDYVYEKVSTNREIKRAFEYVSIEETAEILEKLCNENHLVTKMKGGTFSYIVVENSETEEKMLVSPSADNDEHPTQTTTNVSIQRNFVNDVKSTASVFNEDVVLRPEFEALVLKVNKLVNGTKPDDFEVRQYELKRQVDKLKEELDSKNIIIEILQKQLVEAVNSLNHNSQSLSINLDNTKYQQPRRVANNVSHHGNLSNAKEFNVQTSNRFDSLGNCKNYEENDDDVCIDLNVISSDNHGNHKQLNTRRNTKHLIGETILNTNNNTAKTNHINIIGKKEAMKNKRSVTILGDSMIKGIQGYKMKQALKNEVNVYVKSFPGANVEDMNSYVKPTQKRSPNAIVIHCGTNELREEKPAEIIADDIVTLARSLKTDTNDVIVSGIVPRADHLDGKRKLVNAQLSRKLSERNLGYLDNSNIDVNLHLNKSGLHLNYLGTKRLADNILEIINL